MGGGLASSRHALTPLQKRRSIDAVLDQALANPRRPQSTPVETINAPFTGKGNTDLGSSVDELHRFTKIVRRLNWKYPFLESGYLNATNRLNRDKVQVEETELMFKLDFYEYYALIERALVHLLGVYGIRISAAVVSDWRSESRFESHAYHANVLSALDDPKNPLHKVLGTGEVRWQLGRAKELRNRWKSAGGVLADDDKPHHHRERSPLSASRWATKKVAAPLESYRLEEILHEIFKGLDAAFAIAQRFIETGAIEQAVEDGIYTLGNDDVNMMDWSLALTAASGENSSDDESQWKFMTDAMDWQSV